MRDDLDIPYPAMGQVQGTAYSPRDYRGAARLDPNTKRLAIIAGGITMSFLVLMGVWSLTGHKRSGVPVIEADSRPVRERPLNKGGLQITGADESILSGETEGKAVVAPAPEAPAVAALKATPVQASVPLPEPATQPSVRVGGLEDVPATPLLNASRPAVPKPAPAPAAKVVTAAPVAKPSVASVAVASAAVPSAGRAQIQLAAVGSEEAAKSEWTRLSRKYPELLGGRQSAVTKTERDGKTYWRLRVTGFADASAASSFCGQLKAKGGACAPASF